MLDDQHNSQSLLPPTMDLLHLNLDLHTLWSFYNDNDCELFFFQARGTYYIMVGAKNFFTHNFIENFGLEKMTFAF